MTARHGGWLVVLALILAAGCELEEVAAPDSADILVVEAVLRAGEPRQHILLHRSIEGNVVEGERDASVAVRVETGMRVQYEEAGISNCILGGEGSGGGEDAELEDLELRATCYVSPPHLSGFVQPGLQYELEIETARGEIVRGRTRLPGPYGFTSPATEPQPSPFEFVCTLPDFAFPLTWTRSEGAWSYIVTMHIEGWSDFLELPDGDAPDPLELTSVSVSAADTTLIFPTNVGLFQRGEVDSRLFDFLRDGIPAGIPVHLAVMAAERNYTNAIRGGRFNPSGNPRLSSVVGDAVGVFGGVVPLLIHSVPGPDGWPPACAVSPA